MNVFDFYNSRDEEELDKLSFEAKYMTDSDDLQENWERSSKIIKDNMMLRQQKDHLVTKELDVDKEILNIGSFISSELQKPYFMHDEYKLDCLYRDQKALIDIKNGW